MASSSSSSSFGTPDPDSILIKDVIPRMSQWHYRDPEANSAGGVSVYIARSICDRSDVQVQLAHIGQSMLPLAVWGGFAPKADPCRLTMQLTLPVEEQVTFFKM